MVVMVGGDIDRFILVLAMMLIFHQYHIKADTRSSLIEQYIQTKAYVKCMNKPTNMTIQVQNGDVYDCIDIHKQPAFDHPSLRNHELQMVPTAYPNGVVQNNNDIDMKTTMLNTGGCPNGTVPIQRPRGMELPESRSHISLGNKVDDGIHHYALTSTPETGEYYGTRAFMNVWNPKVGNAESFSVSQLWIVAGPLSELNTIEVGWIVYPKLYGDSRTRLVTYWTADAYKTGCYNTRCPGFVQVNNRIPIDGSLDRVSTYKGEQYDIKIDVFKDPKTGNWFLLKDDLVVGYWPNSLFNHLNTKAESVQWGGEVALCGGCPFPQMGSGYSPEFGYGEASYMKGIKVIDNSDMVLNDPKDCFLIESMPKCYRIQSNPIESSPLTGYHIVYGGTC